MSRFFRHFSITLVLSIVSMWGVIFLTPPPPLLQGVSFSRAVFDKNQQLLRLTLSEDGKYRYFVPLSEIAPALRDATLLKEDQFFYWHPGVNPFSLMKAAWVTSVGPKHMGASTITMQLARIRFSIYTKSVSGKCLQIFRALQLTAHYSKQQILEAYLNLAPYGNNIEGAGAASLIYFGKLPRDLNLPDALTLTIIPQNPSKRVPDRPALQAIRAALFNLWLKKHPEDSRRKPLMALPLQMRNIHAVPFLAPHLVNHVLYHETKGKHIDTLVNSRFQRVIERVTRHYVARKSNVGVKNAAVLLIDTRDMSVKAMLGSVEFFNTAISGQIDGTAAKRSPGSTLKPFIYALALDQGLIHPGTVLKDVPHSFGSYNPENFDNDFVGPIKAKEALILSRNIPAIYLADKLKRPSLYTLLQQAEVSDLKPESYYGLALALGGAEMSMQELASLYAMLANEGVWQPLRFTEADPISPGKKLISPEASFLVLDMLSETTMPAHYLGAYKSRLGKVAWKTGTSSGYRDAWTVGVAKPFVLAVWLGNFNNQGNPVFIGKETAAPLFFEIMNALSAELTANDRVLPSSQPLHLTKVDVCKVSGMLPSPYCKDREKVWFIPGKSPIKIDTIHREVAINSVTGLRACHFDQQTRFDIYEFWSSDLLRIFKRAGIQRRSPPLYDAQCAQQGKANTGFSPQILSPLAGVDYIFRINETVPSLIPFSAVVDADVRYVYWFIDAIYLGKTERDRVFMWHGKPGMHVVRVVDEYGRSDARVIKVSATS